jgi:hypothetical protein
MGDPGHDVPVAQHATAAQEVMRVNASSPGRDFLLGAGEVEGAPTR